MYFQSKIKVLTILSAGAAAEGSVADTVDSVQQGDPTPATPLLHIQKASSCWLVSYEKDIRGSHFLAENWHKSSKLTALESGEGSSSLLLV